MQYYLNQGYKFGVNIIIIIVIIFVIIHFYGGIRRYMRSIAGALDHLHAFRDGLHVFLGLEPEYGYGRCPGISSGHRRRRGRGKRGRRRRRGDGSDLLLRRRR